MHLLLVIDSLVPGGAERSLAALAPHYVRSGVRLDVAYLHPFQGLQAKLHASGAKLFCVTGPGGRVGWALRIRRLLAERRPHLVHTVLFESHLAGRVAGALAGVPVVSSLVGEPYGDAHRAEPDLVPWKVRAAQVLDAVSARKVVRFHAVSHHVANVMSHRLRIPRGLIEVIPRGREPGVLGQRTPSRRARARAMLGVEDGTRVVLAVAREEYPKGLDLLLEAFPLVLRELPGSVLVVAGGRGKQTPLHRETAVQLSLGDSVLFLGPREDVPELLCAADVFVLPSRREGFPGVLLEAMALEAPIVATDLPPVREVLGEDGIGGLVSWEAPGELGRAIVESLRDGEAISRRVRSGRFRFLKEFDVAGIAERMLGFYERALASGRRARR